jgi:hypothetical protein
MATNETKAQTAADEQSYFDLKTSAAVALLAIVTWNMVTAWDALIDKLVLTICPWEPDSIWALIMVALITSIIAIIVMYNLRRNVSDVLGVTIADPSTTVHKTT